MGTYDRVEVNGTVYQTKSLGKSLQLKTVGSSAVVQASAMTAKEFELAPTHAYQDVPERYTVKAISEDPDSSEEVFLLIEAGIIVGTIDAASADLLPSFDYYGRSLNGLQPVIKADPMWVNIRGSRPRRQVIS